MKNSETPAYPVEASYNGNNNLSGVQTGNNTGYELGFTKREAFFKDILCAIESNSFEYDSFKDLIERAKKITNLAMDEINKEKP